MADLTIASVKQDAADEMELLVREHQPMVYRIAFSVLRNHDEAEDAAQEAFLRVWRAPGKLARVADRKAWVARVAWNAAIDRRRSERQRSEHELAELAGVVANLASSAADADQIARGGELQKLLELLIASLPAKLREVLELSTVEELDSQEVSRVLGLSAGAVRSRLFEARQILRTKLEKLMQPKSEKSEWA